jgi:tetratricopeptide (TPR) repeat protein
MKYAFLILLACIIACRGNWRGGKSEQVKILLRRASESDAKVEYKSSIKIYDSILQLESDNFISLINRGRAKLVLGDSVSGMEDLVASLKIHPTYQAFALKAVGEINSDPKQALVDIRSGNQLSPGKGLITSLLATYYSSIVPLRDSALFYADKTCRIPQIDPGFYGGAMDAYLYFGDYKNLLKVTDSIIAHPMYSPITYLAYPYNNKGLAELMLGEIQEAKQDIQISLTIDSNNAWADRNMSLVFDKMHKFDSSCYYIQLARKKDKKKQYQKAIDSLIIKFCTRK